MKANEFYLIIDSEMKLIKDKYGFEFEEPLKKICEFHATYISAKVKIEIFINSPEINFLIEPLVQPKSSKDYSPKAFDFFEIIRILAPQKYKDNFLNNLNDSNADLVLKNKMADIVALLLTFCANILDGDFTIWPELIKKRKEFNENFWKKSK